jgi:hypothetical protein
MEVTDVLRVRVCLDRIQVSELCTSHVFVFDDLIQGALLPAIFDAPVELGRHSLLLVFFVRITVLVLSVFAELAHVLFEFFVARTSPIRKCRSLERKKQVLRL